MGVVGGVDDLFADEQLDDLAQHVFIGRAAPWCRSSHLAKTPRAIVPPRRSSNVLKAFYGRTYTIERKGPDMEEPAETYVNLTRCQAPGAASDR